MLFIIYYILILRDKIAVLLTGSYASQFSYYNCEDVFWASWGLIHSIPDIKEGSM